MRCDVCGTENPEGSKFCIKCGNDLEAQGHIICGACGYENSADAKFCKKCGKSLSEESGKMAKDKADQENYNKAKQLIDSGDIANILQARELFRGLTTVRDVTGKLEQCEKLIDDKYRQAIDLAGRDDINSLEQAIRTLTLLKGERECSDQIARAQEALNKKKEEAREKKKKNIVIGAVIGVAVLAVIIVAAVMLSHRANAKIDGLSLKLSGDWKQAGDVQTNDYDDKYVYYDLGDTSKQIALWHMTGYDDAKDAVSYYEDDYDYEVSEISDNIKNVDEAYLVGQTDGSLLSVYVSKGSKVYSVDIQTSDFDDDYSQATFTKDIQTIKIE